LAKRRPEVLQSAVRSDDGLLRRLQARRRCHPGIMKMSEKGSFVGGCSDENDEETAAVNTSSYGAVTEAGISQMERPTSRSARSVARSGWSDDGIPDTTSLMHRRMGASLNQNGA
jgi:hypothetical protein